MKFSRKHMESQLKEVHPELRAVLEDFERWSAKHGYPEPVLTEVTRSVPEMVAIYVPYWKGLVSRLVAGQLLTASERQTAQEKRGASDDELTAQARARFSWHLVKCAVDIRTRHYSLAQLTDVRARFGRLGTPLWENLVHDVHGPHQHLARRDFAWRTRHDPRHVPGGPDAA